MKSKWGFLKWNCGEDQFRSTPAFNWCLLHPCFVKPGSSAIWRSLCLLLRVFFFLCVSPAPSLLCSCSAFGVVGGQGSSRDSQGRELRCGWNYYCRAAWAWTCSVYSASMNTNSLIIWNPVPKDQPLSCALSPCHMHTLLLTLERLSAWLVCPELCKQDIQRRGRQSLVLEGLGFFVLFWLSARSLGPTD